MKLDRVTITGADESIEPKHLEEISTEYPFVEWGILISSKRTPVGYPRFPSWKWLGGIRDLMTLHTDANKKNDIRWSAHLCGDIVRTLATKAEWAFPLSLLDGFQRIQLNFHGEELKFDNFFPEMLMFHEKQFILQMDNVNDHILPIVRKRNIDAVPLFDGSHGAGILPGSWPKPIEGIYNGYAGGLGPNNLKKQMDKIAEAAGDAHIWIDMETKIRSDNDKLFDLDKVTQCLDIAKDYIVT